MWVRASLVVGVLRYLGDATGLRRTDLSALAGCSTRTLDRSLEAAKRMGLVERVQGRLSLTVSGLGAWESSRSRGLLRRYEVRRDWRKSPHGIAKRLRALLLSPKGRECPSVRQLALMLQASRSGVRRALRLLESRGEVLTGLAGGRSGFYRAPGGRRRRYWTPRRFAVPAGVAAIFRAREAQKAERERLSRVIPATSPEQIDHHRTTPGRAGSKPPPPRPWASVGDALGALGL